MSNQEVEDEVKAIKNVLKVHKDLLEINEKGLRANNYVLDLVEKDLRNRLKK